MRRVITFQWMTADGYFAAADGNLDWVVPDDEQAKDAAAGISRIDTALFGRTTYETFAQFWRAALAQSDGSTVPDPHHPGRRSREHHTVAVALNEMAKIVYSRTLMGATWKNSRIVRELDPGEIDAMKQAPGKDIIVFGSGSIVSQLTAHGLIDEYQLAVCPVFIGNGRRLLDGASKKLSLREAKPLPSGDVLLRYARSA